MLTWAIIAIEAVSAVALIFLVLLHSGRGGGISDLMGGSLGAAATGSTVVERNLDRITVATALVVHLRDAGPRPTPAVTGMFSRRRGRALAAGPHTAGGLRRPGDPLRGAAFIQHQRKRRHLESLAAGTL